MKSYYLLFAMFAGMFPASVFGSYEPTVMRFVAKAAMSADNDSLIAKSDTLGEITVMAAPVTRYDDHLLLYPTKEQRRHASNGFDVMKNMMIPGVDVDAKGGSISAFGAKATIYVNGLPADVNDIRMMRPKDIERIEYYDVPTGKYSRDKLAVNFVAKEYRYGGYVMADASQTIGFNSGNYNASATLNYGDMTYSVFAGGGYSDIGGISSDVTEVFRLPSGDVRRTRSVVRDTERNNEYGQFRLRFRRNKTSITSYIGLSRSALPSSAEHGTMTDVGVVSESFSRTSQSGLSPYMGVSGEHSWNGNQILTFQAGGSYSRNKYSRSYAERDFNTLADSKENAVDFNLKTDYTRYGRKWSATAMASFNCGIFDSEYTGTYASSNHLWMSDLEVLMSGRYFLNSRLSIRGLVGASLLTYNHRGTDKYTYLSPAVNLQLQYRTRHGMLSWGSFYTEPSYGASEMSDERMDVDKYMVVQGVPRRHRPKYLSSSLYYSGQFGRLGVSLMTQHTFSHNYFASVYYAEDEKVVRSNRSDGDMYSGYVGASATYTFSKRLTVSGSASFTHTNVHAGVGKHDNSVTGSASLNWYLKDFSLQPYLVLRSRKLVPSSMQMLVSPLSYGLKATYRHKNLYVALNTGMPFNDWKQHVWLDTPAYSLDNETCSRGNSRYLSVSVSYSFDFGRRVERDMKMQEVNSESSLMKV